VGADPGGRTLDVKQMKTYDFSKGKRGAVIPVPPAINKVLRDYVEGKKAGPGLEDTLRRVIREELRKVS
jgi:hypothetical protein